MRHIGLKLSSALGSWHRVTRRMALLILMLAVHPPLCAGTLGDRQSLIEQLIGVDREFSRASERLGIVEALFRFQESDAFLLNSATTSRERTRQANSGRFDDRVISHTPRFAEVSSSGDLGYTWGDWISVPKLIGSNSKGESFGGTYVNIWKRQSDGGWKLVVDGVARLLPQDLERFRQEMESRKASAASSGQP